MHQLLYDIVDAFDAGNVVQLGELLSSIRTRSRQAESPELSFPGYEQNGQSEQSRESRQSTAEMDFKEGIEVCLLCLLAFALTDTASPSRLFQARTRDDCLCLPIPLPR